MPLVPAFFPCQCSRCVFKLHQRKDLHSTCVLESGWSPSCGTGSMTIQYSTVCARKIETRSSKVMIECVGTQFKAPESDAS